ncbi:hypothetical protein QUA30_03685 [Microcoleus sp. Pol14C2]|uniref:hypothetical protein n=1 Tax=unclassified Microcoleus TaxID=2642155 RepID=UPI002FD5C66C
MPIRADRIKTCDRAIALDTDRTVRKIIRLETKRAIEHELKGDRSIGIFKVLGIAIEA